MGFRTYSTVAPFKISIGESLPESMDNFVCRKFEPFNEHGWFCGHSDWIEELGKVYTTPFVKENIQIPDPVINDIDVEGDFKVLLVNESAYSIERFCEDFNINTEIIENTTVQFSI